MAKARDIPGLTTDLPYGEVAARVLEVRVAELIEHSQNVLDMEEIEGVHSMRVATRRLRAAIEIFWPCFPKEDEKRVLKQVKALADALGERRDRDVAIEALDAFAAAMPAPDRPGIQSLVERYGDEQRQANVELEPFVDPARLRLIHDEVLKLAAAAREGIGGDDSPDSPAEATEPERPAVVPADEPPADPEADAEADTDTAGVGEES
ncbi:MAG: CHAD domain-containing protein [Solirubrobacterales bacterium]